MRTAALLLVLSLAGCSAASDVVANLPSPASPPSPSAPAVDITGTWAGSEWGPMRLVQDTTGAVSGDLADYDYRSRIVGTVSGNRLTGYWTSPDGNSPCETSRDGTRYHGRIEFTFTGNRFMGRYSLCADDPNYFDPDNDASNGPYVEGERVR
ncbi:MAG: hypothetical protein AAF791_13625 [Bacteroidota bacterium]